jgi:hypothetical protein
MIEFYFACHALLESSFYTCCKRFRLRADEGTVDFEYLSLASDSEVGVLAGFEDPENVSKDDSRIMFDLRSCQCCQAVARVFWCC